MARIFTDGAEDPRGDLEWVNTGANRVTSPVRSGVYAWRLYNTGNSMYRLFTASDEFYFRVAWHNTDGTADPNESIAFCSGTTILVALRLDVVNKFFRVLVGSTQVAVGTFSWNPDTWYLLEFHIKIADTGGIIQMKVDGIMDIDYTGDTKPSTQTTIDNLYLRGLGNEHIKVDDIAINDTSGAADNSWCGEGRVIYLPDDSAGDSTQLTPNTGENWAAVDERAHDSDTTHVEGSTVDNYDLYNLIASGLATGSTILRVIPVAVARDTIANGGKIQIGIKTNSTEYWSADKTLAVTYTGQDGNEYLVNPQTGVAWTIAELDALQVGVKVRGT